MITSFLVADPAANPFIDISNATAVVGLVGLLLPLVTGLVTKSMATGGLKSLVTLALSVITSVIAVLATADGHYDWRGFLSAFLVAFVPAIASYYGLWKPTGVAGSVANAAPNTGLGKPVAVTDDKGAEEAGDVARGDAGYAVLGIIGLVLVVAGVIIVVGDLINQINTSWFIGVIIAVIGLVLMAVDRRGNAVL